MTARLQRLAVDAHPTDDVRAVVVAVHERAGAKLALIVAPAVVIVAGLLDWPLWLAAAVAAASASTAYSVMTTTSALVVLADEIVVHRTPRFSWFRIRLGSPERTVRCDAIEPERSGWFHEAWMIGGTRFRVDRTDRQHLRDLLERCPDP